MHEFRQKYKFGKNSEKPILFIYWPEFWMKNFVSDYQAVLREYGEMFDIYYCGDEKEAKKYFDIDSMPEMVANVFIIEPNNLQPLKSAEGYE